VPRLVSRLDHAPSGTHFLVFSLLLLSSLLEQGCGLDNDQRPVVICVSHMFRLFSFSPTGSPFWRIGVEEPEPLRVPNVFERASPPAMFAFFHIPGSVFECL